MKATLRLVYTILAAGVLIVALLYVLELVPDPVAFISGAMILWLALTLGLISLFGSFERKE